MRKRKLSIYACPFCGEGGTVERVPIDGSRKHQWYVHCSNNYCIASTCHKMFSTKDEAIHDWNSRAEF